MEPLNQTERQAALRRFAGLYCLSLTVPLLAVYFLFSAPTGMLKAENTQLKKTLAEQTQQLMKRVHSVTGSLTDLQTTDQAYLKATDLEKGGLKTKLSGLESTIQQQVNNIKTDTIAFEPINKQLSGGLIDAYDAVLTYRNNIGYLREILEKKGIDAAQVDKLTAALTQVRQENEMLKIMAARSGGAAPAPTPAPSSGSNNAQYLAQIQECNNKLTTAQTRITKLEDQLKNISAPPVAQSVSTGVSRADVEMELVDRCERKADTPNRPPLWRRPLYEFAVETLERSGRSDARQRITTINDKLRRLSAD